MRRMIGFGLLAAMLSGCVGVEATRTSRNTMLIDVGAAPSCGAGGAARAAALSAAVETIRAGFERYTIDSSLAENNVTVTPGIGRFETRRTAIGSMVRTETRYVPGAPVVRGTQDRHVSITMYKEGDPGFEDALDAREQLGPGWQDYVRNGVQSC